MKMHDLGVEHLSDIQVSEVENSNSAMQIFGYRTINYQFDISIWMRT